MCVCVPIPSVEVALRVYLKRTAGWDRGEECILMLQCTLDTAQSPESAVMLSIFLFSTLLRLLMRWPSTCYLNA